MPQFGIDPLRQLGPQRGAEHLHALARATAELAAAGITGGPQ